MKPNFQNAANTYSNGLAGSQSVPVPRTIASALSRMDDVGDRLAKVRESLNALADQIGGPRPVDANALKESAPATGAVHRLNDAADRSHDILSDIEGLLNSISHSLG